MRIGSSLIVCIALFSASCSSLPEKRAIVPNPTRYIFNRDKQSLRNAIISELSPLKYRNMMLYYNGSFRPLDTLGIFLLSENKDDFYLSPSFIWIDESFMYPGLHYHASFHLHLIEVDENRTEVVVFTIKPRVILGKNFWPSFPHFVRDYKYKAVSPSTVEEYEILFRIGKSLNEDMPRVNYPERAQSEGQGLPGFIIGNFIAALWTSDVLTLVRH
jgi:hypothetical protein